MERYTFTEIQNFQIGDIFWSRGQQYIVDTEPTYISENTYLYHGWHEKVEWTAISQQTLRQSKFQISNTTNEQGQGKDPIIFKTPTSEPIST